MTEFKEDMIIDDVEESCENWLSEELDQGALVTPEVMETLALLKLVAKGALFQSKHRERKDN